jgi:hypothetical protein
MVKHWLQILENLYIIFLKAAKPIQIVHNLRQKKAKGPLSMLPAHEFLRDLKFEE